MTDITQIVKVYAELERERAEIDESIKELRAEIEEYVKESGNPIEAHGLRCHMKPGRRSTDHKGIVDNMDILSPHAAAEYITVYTTQPPPRTQWARVTNAMKVPQDVLDRHTTQAPAKFTIDKVKVVK